LATGGSPAAQTGGAPATGGTTAALTATGGTVATGGSSGVSSGGTRTNTGGTFATGGSKAAATGGATVTATGGAVSTSCTTGLTGSPSPGSAAFTWYFFGQGTYMTNGKYQTACGYQGTEPTKNNQQSVDNVTNIANSAYFVAIPGATSANFTNVNKCGACVKITNGGKSSIATVIDECPIDSNSNCSKTGALDLSTQLFNSLGYSVGNPSGTTWSFVACPVTGNVVVRFKPNNNNQEIYIENSILAIGSVTASSGGSATRTSYGSWHFGSALSTGSTLTITDAAGRIITWDIAATSADTNQDTGKQFPACS